jgi:hypothetical protein
MKPGESVASDAVAAITLGVQVCRMAAWPERAKAGQSNSAETYSWPAALTHEWLTSFVNGERARSSHRLFAPRK